MHRSRVLSTQEDNEEANINMEAAEVDEEQQSDHRGHLGERLEQRLDQHLHRLELAERAERPEEPDHPHSADVAQDQGTPQACNL